MSKRPLVPSFLQSLDDKLLRNKPGAWSARTHLALYFAIGFAVLLFAFCYFVFFDAKQYSNIALWNSFVAVLAFIGLVFWLIYLLRFNVFKRYGNWFAFDGLRDLLLYFASIAALVAVCFIPSAVETMRANQQFGNKEIVKDINEINITACRLEFALLPLEWKGDTCKVVEKERTVASTEDVFVIDTIDGVEVERIQYTVNRYRLIDTAELNNKLEFTDSLLQLNDSMYVFYECPDYLFVSSYNADAYSNVKMLSSADIYNSILKNYRPPDREPLVQRMAVLKAKYAVNGRYDYDDTYVTYNDDSYQTRINKKYQLGKMSNGIDNIVQKKYAWKASWQDYLRVFYYISLFVTLLVFIFRHTTAKTFFLSVLTAVLLTILTGLLLVFTMGDETSVFSFMVVYYVVFAALALSIFKAKVRNAIQGIGLNLFLFMTPFIPLVFVALNMAMRERYIYATQQHQDINSAQQALYFLIAEFAGAVILLILIQPLFKKLYRKWYAAPEE